MPLGETVGQLVSLPALFALAVELQPGNSPLGSHWLLVGRDSTSCALRRLAWAPLNLPELDREPDALGLASSDFNGDGMPDFAAASRGELVFYPGQLGGRFAQGDQYALSAPLGALSTA